MAKSLCNSYFVNLPRELKINFPYISKIMCTENQDTRKHVMKILFMRQTTEQWFQLVPKLK